MPNIKTDPDLLNLMEKSLTGHGWLGRMFGVKQWLRGGTLVSARPAPISVAAIRRRSRPDSAYPVFDSLREEGVPFRSILIDVPDTENNDIPTATDEKSGADIHLILSDSAPWYTAFNLGAACAAGEHIVFLDGAARPEANFLAAYRDIFRAHPETSAARGAVLVPGLEDCSLQATGAFVLAEETEFWPLDLDENMAVRARDFFALGGFDESLIGGCGALDFSIRLFGRDPNFHCQRYAPLARAVLDEHGEPDLPVKSRLIQRQRSWLQLNDSLKRYLELYAKFWRERTHFVERPPVDYGTPDFAVRLLGRDPGAPPRIDPADREEAISPMKIHMLRRERAWARLNDALDRCLETHDAFRPEQGGGKDRG